MCVEQSTKRTAPPGPRVGAASQQLGLGSSQRLPPSHATHTSSGTSAEAVGQNIHMASPCDLGSLTAWPLNSKSKWLKTEVDRSSITRYDPDSGIRQHHFCLILFIKSRSLRSTHTQGEGIQLNLLMGRVSKNWQTCLKPPQRLKGR